MRRADTPGDLSYLYNSTLRIDMMILARELRWQPSEIMRLNVVDREEIAYGLIESARNQKSNMKG